jgi:hypothetical protein
MRKFMHSMRKSFLIFVFSHEPFQITLHFVTVFYSLYMNTVHTYIVLASVWLSVSQCAVSRSMQISRVSVQIAVKMSARYVIALLQALLSHQHEPRSYILLHHVLTYNFHSATPPPPHAHRSFDYPIFMIGIKFGIKSAKMFSLINSATASGTVKSKCFLG